MLMTKTHTLPKATRREHQQLSKAQTAWDTFSNLPKAQIHNQIVSLTSMDIAFLEEDSQNDQPESTTDS